MPGLETGCLQNDLVRVSAPNRRPPTHLEYGENRTWGDRNAHASSPPHLDGIVPYCSRQIGRNHGDEWLVFDQYGVRVEMVIPSSNDTGAPLHPTR